MVKKWLELLNKDVLFVYTKSDRLLQVDAGVAPIKLLDLVKSGSLNKVTNRLSDELQTSSTIGTLSNFANPAEASSEEYKIISEQLVNELHKLHGAEDPALPERLFELHDAIEELVAELTDRWDNVHLRTFF